MRDKEKTKEQLITELVELRQRIDELEKSEKLHKITKQMLNESEQMLRSIIEHSNEIFYIHDTHQKLSYISPQSKQILGYTPDEMMVEWTNLITENPINKTGIKITEKALKTGKTQKPYLLELYRKDGGRVWLEIDESPLIDKEGNVIGIVGAARDFTERRRVEEALRDSEEKFRTLTETNAAAIFIYQGNNFRYVNPATEAITGYSKEELLTMKFWDVVHPEFKELVKERGLARQRWITVPMRYEFKIITKSGEERWVDATAGPIEFEGKPAAIGTAFDITERRIVEEALRESEKRYHAIFEDSREAICITTRDGRFVEVNQSTLDLFGYTREEILKLNVLQIYANPSDRNKFQQEIEQSGSVRNYSVKLRKKDGTEIDCLLTFTIWKSIDGTISGYQGIIRDITEIKKVEDQLRYLSMHDQLTGLYNRAYFEEEMHRIESGRHDSAGIIMCDVDGLKLINDALGHPAGDNLLLSAANALKESFREGDVVARVGGDEFAILLPDSDRVTLEIACNRIRDNVLKCNSSKPKIPLSLSIGFAISNESPIIMSNIFKEADNNMYREKLDHALSARSTIVQTLMKALETRDFIAKGHVNRLQKLAAALAKAIGLPDHRIADLHHLAEFHDIGKVGIPDSILFKAEPLTPEEIIEIRRHCEIGHRIALCTPDLVPIADLILKHHEWYNGKGYPLGIKGEEIPLECRILSIAEAYEAMTNDRPYQKAMSHKEALSELIRGAGTKFDRDLVSKFIQVLENINEGFIKS